MTMPTPKTLHHTDGFTRYQKVTPETLLSIHRDTIGPNEPGERFTATYDEAEREGWLNDGSAIGVRIADEHAPAYFTQDVDWRRGRAVVYEQVDME